MIVGKNHYRVEEEVRAEKVEAEREVTNQEEVVARVRGEVQHLKNRPQLPRPKLRSKISLQWDRNRHLQLLHDGRMLGASRKLQPLKQLRLPL